MKKLFLFIVQHFSLAIFFYFVLSLAGRSDLADPEKVDVEVTLHTDSSGKLFLTPGDSVRAWPGKKVTWIIDPASNIKSFSVNIVKTKGRSKHIFYIWQTPPSNCSGHGYGRVDALRHEADYIYSISWTDKADQPHTYDPKIAIIPTSKFDFIKWIILIVYGLLAVLLTGRFFLSRNNK